MTNATTIHPFESAGLGIAPFRVIGVTEILFQAAPGAPVRAGGSCDFCATCIRDAYIVRGADGRKFKVGSDCVRRVASKCADTALSRSLALAEAPARRARAAAAREKRQAREAAKRAELAATAETRLGSLLSRLDAAATQHCAFADMARDLRHGRRATLSPAQLAWLERVEAAQ